MNNVEIVDTGLKPVYTEICQAVYTAIIFLVLTGSMTGAK
jgi:hypothetical protein